ncbi:MAG: hypothetical protein KKG59_00385 [Nanoarchaeota archaeon]|nr:hypothetical protein [Nanoarchaeota archaeon]
MDIESIEPVETSEYTSGLVRSADGTYVDGIRLDKARKHPQTMIDWRGDRLRKHPATGPPAMQIYDALNYWFKHNDARYPGKMADLILNDGLHPQIEDAILKCKHVGERRKITNRFGELFLLSEWLPEGVYGAISLKYNLPTFMNKGDGLRNAIMEYVMDQGNQSYRDAIEFLAGNGLSKNTGLESTVLQVEKEGATSTEKTDRLKWPIFESLRISLPPGYWGIIAAVHDLPAVGLGLKPGKYFDKSDIAGLKRDGGYSPKDALRLERTAIETRERIIVEKSKKRKRKKKNQE